MAVDKKLSSNSYKFRVLTKVLGSVSLVSQFHKQINVKVNSARTMKRHTHLHWTYVIQNFT